MALRDSGILEVECKWETNANRPIMVCLGEFRFQAFLEPVGPSEFTNLQEFPAGSSDLYQLTEVRATPRAFPDAQNQEKLGVALPSSWHSRSKFPQ